MANKRLLTPEELDKIHRRVMHELMAQDKSLGLAEAIALAVQSKETKQQELEDQDAKTLREVGEWLENNAVTLYDNWGNQVRGFWVALPANPDQKNDWRRHIEALKQGKMPK